MLLTHLLTYLLDTLHAFMMVYREAKFHLVACLARLLKRLACGDRHGNINGVKSYLFFVNGTGIFFYILSEEVFSVW